MTGGAATLLGSWQSWAMLSSVCSIDHSAGERPHEKVPAWVQLASRMEINLYSPMASCSEQLLGAGLGTELENSSVGVSLETRKVTPAERNMIRRTGQSQNSRVNRIQAFLSLDFPFQHLLCFNPETQNPSIPA